MTLFMNSFAKRREIQVLSLERVFFNHGQALVSGGHQLLTTKVNSSLFQKLFFHGLSGQKKTRNKGFMPILNMNTGN